MTTKPQHNCSAEQWMIENTHQMDIFIFIASIKGCKGTLWICHLFHRLNSKHMTVRCINRGERQKRKIEIVFTLWCQMTEKV